MPIVFVHGVNVRKGAAYDAQMAVLQKFLQKHLSNATINGKALKTTEVLCPYWGDLGATFAWGMKALPSGDIDSLGVPGVDEKMRAIVARIDDALPDPEQARDEPLTVLAKQDLRLAVDALSRVLIDRAKAGETEDIAAFVVAAQSYADANPQPAWLLNINTDQQLVNRLVAEVKAKEVQENTAVEALGIFDAIINPISAAVGYVQNAVQQAADTVFDRVGDFASTKLLGWVREPLNGHLGRFFGDIFIYFNTRGEKNRPGTIPQLILDAIEEAVKKSPAGEPLVIIGHSLGGVILFDLLSHYTNREVDLLVTVGSQVPHFEEIKLFHGSDRSIPKPGMELAEVPANIKQWINVFDPVDIFAYSAKNIFSRVDDYGYDTMTHTVEAHGAYLEQDRFYARLRARIK